VKAELAKGTGAQNHSAVMLKAETQAEEEVLNQLRDLLVDTQLSFDAVPVPNGQGMTRIGSISIG
jgi:hypothetical protein